MPEATTRYRRRRRDEDRDEPEAGDGAKYGAIAGAIVGVVLLAMFLLRLGGAGGGAARPRVRLTATGLTIDNVVATIDGVLAACRAAGGCDVVVTGDVIQRDWQALVGALVAARVPFSVRPPAGLGGTGGVTLSFAFDSTS